LEYEGSDFLGWQRLSHGPTLQLALEEALSFVADRPVEVICSGRTDAGVHAECQVVHFDCDAQRPMRGWLRGCNSRLPGAMSVLWVMPVDEEFHARYAARARRYRYRLLNRSIRPGLHRRSLAWERRPLDAERMHAAAQQLLGEQDFSAFRTAQCQARHPVRTLQAIAVQRIEEVVSIEVQANAFLHHMVRNIVGSLLLIGAGERPPEWLAELLAGRDRTLAGPTAQAAGLTFIGPLYPAQWQLPAAVTLAASVPPTAAVLR
jgi:tRNA pseudouridine38-40 synthase